MSPLFGNKGNDSDKNAAVHAQSSALQSEVDRLDALPLPQLASEVMTKGFGPGGPGEDAQNSVTVGGMSVNAGPTVGDIASALVPGCSGELAFRLARIAAEGVQTLEHASLVRTQMHTSTGALDYAASRLGRSALQQGTVDRVLGGGSL
jgi:hypothetical protein